MAAIAGADQKLARDSAFMLYAQTSRATIARTVFVRSAERGICPRNEMSTARVGGGGGGGKR